MQPSQFTPILAALLVACAPRNEPPSTSEADTTPEGVVDIVVRGLTFEAPDEVPSGWTTFRLRNESSMIHFAAIEKLPEGQGFDSQQAEVAPVFQDGMDFLTAGDVDAAMARFGDLPAWFGEIEFIGGPGLTSAGRESQATVFLEPGTYLLECYVKTGGIFHSFSATPSIKPMIHEFTVTAGSSEALEPQATLKIEISTEGGIAMMGDVVAGEHTVAVHFADQTVHENFVEHDVHLVQATDDLDLSELEHWMDWSEPEGLQTPSPALFLGGLNEMPAGTTGYFTVTLEEGDYVWVSEVPGSAAKGMLVPFHVGAGEG